MAALVAGVATVTGVLIALASPAAATVREVVAVAQDCGNGQFGSGNRTCVESSAAPARTTGATVQDCGGWAGSGNRTCVESSAAPAASATV